MIPQIFYLGVLLVDDDPDIVDQHKFLLDNRAFRRQTPGRLYVMLRDVGLIDADDSLDVMINAGRWPSKKDVESVFILNPELDTAYTIVEPDIAYSADEASEIWDDQRAAYTSGELGCYIAILDHDMSGKTGLDLAEEWRKATQKSFRGAKLVLPLIVFYTGERQC